VAIANDVAARVDVLEHALRHAGHQCCRFMSGEELLHGVQSNERFDALVIELELPDINGIGLLRVILDRPHFRAPVIFTSACDEEKDVAYALHIGADGYLTWPIRGAEFVARLEAIVRRGNGRGQRQPVQVEGYHLDLDARRLFHQSRALTLTEKEFNLAALLLASPGRLLSRKEILQCAWGSTPSSVRWRTVQACMSKLRGKLELTHSGGWRVTAVRRHGYRLEKLDRHTQGRAQTFATCLMLCFEEFGMSAICYLRRCRSRGVTSPPLQAMFYVARWHISMTTGQRFQIALKCPKGRLAQGPALVVMAQAAWERMNWGRGAGRSSGYITRQTWQPSSIRCLATGRRKGTTYLRWLPRSMMLPIAPWRLISWSACSIGENLRSSLCLLEDDCAVEASIVDVA